MAARNCQFPVSRPSVIAPVKHFNARGTVDAPVFTLVRPMAGDGIRLTVRAHCLGNQQWIAEAFNPSEVVHHVADGM